MPALPSLNALRAFEAAARCGSFALAAAELNVTAGAISQQIRQLEDMLGVDLFERTGRKVVLTEAGAAGLDRLGRAFELIGEAAEAMRGSREGERLTVSLPSGFAARWVNPRLARFHANFPDIEVWIQANEALADIESGQVDLSIRYGEGGYRGVNAERLMKEQVFPVAAPSVLKSCGMPHAAGDLDQWPLIHDLSPETQVDGADWRSWFASRAAHGADVARGLRFDQASMVIDAAIAGQGAILGRRALVQDYVRAGKLESIFPGGSLDVGAAYYVITPKGRTLSRAARAFMDWILAEAVRFQDAMDEL
ncbi:transcriptional regulator GcvA [Woodsholea maritima]|uniref:transcriptional regulator GcvA n=1 Tax=Woodsholea maritima TaxID=240237 RepID=UPI00036AA4FC|nr:transcriptional regulator GcvA [Woodsholea maritima]